MNANTQITLFTKLLTTKPDLFAQALPDLAELEQTVKALADDQVAEIENAIWSFCKKPKQKAIIKEVRLSLEEPRGMTGIPTSHITPAEDKTLREQLLNAMRRVIPATHTSQPPKPNHEPTKPSR